MNRGWASMPSPGKVIALTAAAFCIAFTWINVVPAGFCVITTGLLGIGLWCAACILIVFDRFLVIFHGDRLLPLGFKHYFSAGMHPCLHQIKFHAGMLTCCIYKINLNTNKSIRLVFHKIIKKRDLERDNIWNFHDLNLKMRKTSQRLVFYVLIHILFLQILRWVQTGSL
jgi:hypothetical protein